MLSIETFALFDFSIVFAERPIANDRIFNENKISQLEKKNLLCSEHFHVVFVRENRFDHLLDHFLQQLTLIFVHQILLPLIFPNVQMHLHDDITIFDRTAYTQVLDRKKLLTKNI
jgi:hypothetical protein